MNAIDTNTDTEIIDAPKAAMALASQDGPRFAVTANATPSELLRIAIEKGADLDRLERFYELQTKWEQREAMKAFAVAMTDFKAMPLVIFKKKQVGYTTKDGDFVGYAHAELSDITEVVGPAMAQHGLSFRWDIKQDSGRIAVTCCLTHRLGHFEQVSMDAAPDVSGKKNAIQASASAITYLQRYTLLAATGMSTKGMDDDGSSSGNADDEKRRRLWIEDQKANIASAGTVGAVRKIMEYVVAKTSGNNDQAAEDELQESCANKLATVSVTGVKK